MQPTEGRSAAAAHSDASAPPAKRRHGDSEQDAGGGLDGSAWDAQVGRSPKRARLQHQHLNTRMVHAAALPTALTCGLAIVHELQRNAISTQRDILPQPCMCMQEPSPSGAEGVMAGTGRSRERHCCQYWGDRRQHSTGQMCLRQWQCTH